MADSSMRSSPRPKFEACDLSFGKEHNHEQELDLTTTAEKQEELKIDASLYANLWAKTWKRKKLLKSSRMLSTVMSQILITVDNFTQARARLQPTIGMHLYYIVQRLAVCRETWEKVYCICRRKGRSIFGRENIKSRGAAFTAKE